MSSTTDSDYHNNQLRRIVADPTRARTFSNTSSVAPKSNISGLSNEYISHNYVPNFNKINNQQPLSEQSSVPGSNQSSLPGSLFGNTSQVENKTEQSSTNLSSVSSTPQTQTTESYSAPSSNVGNFKSKLPTFGKVKANSSITPSVSISESITPSTQSTTLIDQTPPPPPPTNWGVNQSLSNSSTIPPPPQQFQLSNSYKTPTTKPSSYRGNEQPPAMPRPGPPAPSRYSANSLKAPAPPKKSTPIPTKNQQEAAKKVLNLLNQSIKSKSKSVSPVNSNTQSVKSTISNMYEDYKNTPYMNNSLANLALFAISLLSLIDNDISFVSGGRFDTHNSSNFIKQLKSVFVQMAEKPVKFEKFLVSVDNLPDQQIQIHLNYNLDVRKQIGYKMYSNYLLSNSAKIIQRKCITVLVNLIAEYADCFIDVNTNDKKQFFKAVRQGVSRLLYRYLEFEYAFDSIHSDCSMASSIEGCKAKIGCIHYKGPKRSGCRKVSKINSTYVSLGQLNEVNKMSEQDLNNFNDTLYEVSQVLSNFIVDNTHDITDQKLLAYYNQKHAKLLEVVIPNQSKVVYGGGKEIENGNQRTIHNEDLIALFNK
jgi:hypothetical protein